MPRLEDALVGTVFPAREKRQMRAYLPFLIALMRRCAGVRRAGTCARRSRTSRPAASTAFLMTSLSPWDIAAGALLVKEAGGRVGDFAGGASSCARAR